MAYRKPNGTYLARVRLPNGDRISKVFDTEEAADNWSSSVGSGASLEALSATPQERSVGHLFRSSVDVLWRDSNNIKRLRGQAEALAVYLGEDRDIATVTEADAVNFVEYMIDLERSGSTINNYAAVFNRVLTRAKSKGFRADAPTMDYQKLRKGRVRFLTKEEEARLVAYWEHIGREDYRDLMLFLIDTGCRVGEALSLTWPDVNTKAGVTKLACAVTFWHTKTNEPRTVPASPRVRQMLAQRRDEERPFAMSYSTFKTAFDKAVDTVGLTDVVPHTCRHTCASRLVQVGVDLRRVMMWMGHRSINTTMIYAHLAPEDLFSAADMLEEVA